MTEFEEMPDWKTISDGEAEALCTRLRARLLDVVSRTGGHLASNLGAVEITVALHRVFAPERDRIVFDVGHQCYCHKMLTGRDGAMDTLRSFGGLSGFPKPGESVCDAFSVGHASTSVSVAVGMARARSILRKDYHVVALLGDEATVKRLKRQGREVWLLPENPAYQPIDGREARILGKVAAVIRRY